MLLVFVFACGGALPSDSGRDDDDDDDTELPSDDRAALPAGCGALEVDEARTIEVEPGDDVATVVAAARAGDVVRLAPGTYTMSRGDAADTLRFTADGVTLLGGGDAPEDVVLDGLWTTSELIAVDTDRVTISNLTLANAAGDALAARGADGLWVHRVRVTEPQRNAIDVSATLELDYSDSGILSCVTVLRGTDTCDVGVDLRQAEGWEVRGGVYDAPLCDEPGLRAATGSRGTLLDGALFRGALVAVQLGDTDYAEGEPRVYADPECAGDTVGHYGGLVRNVFVLGTARLEEACGTTVAHASVYGGELQLAFSEGLVGTTVLAAVTDGGDATVSGALRPTAADFVDPDAGDLHLAPGSAARQAGVGIPTGLADVDVDGDPRPTAAPDVGADQAD